jgi:hypothetical protein
VIDPSAIVEVSAIAARGDLAVRTNGEPATSWASLGPGLASEIALGARFFDVLSAHVVGSRAFFSCGEHEGACGATSETFGGALRAELPLDSVRPFVEFGLQHRSLNAPIRRQFQGTSASLSYFNRQPAFIDTRFTGLDLRIGAGVGIALGRGVFLDVTARASFGAFTWYSGESNDNLDPNVSLRMTYDLPEDRQTLHGFYTLGVAFRFGGVSASR